MGKIHIPDDLKHKLNKVFNPNLPTEIPKENKIEKIQTPEKINNDYIPKEINYIKLARVIFFTSFIGGIGLTLGMKIGKIIFY